MRLLPLSFLVTCLAASSAVAHNNYFLPGDAFFSISIPQASIEKWTAANDASIEFSYSRFDGDFYACGNIGYTTLVVDGVTSELRATLAEAYWRYASGHRPLYREEGGEGKSVLNQTNSVVALIYNRTFDLSMPLGLKYNEDWASQGGGRYCGYFATANPVMLDWKDAKSVVPLSVREQLKPLAHLSRGYEVADISRDPLHITADDIQIILVGYADQKTYEVTQRCPNLQSILDGGEGARYMVVTKGLIRDFVCEENGRWTETVVKLPLAEESWIPKLPLKPE